MTTVDLSFIANLIGKNVDETRALRREVGEIRHLALGTLDYMRKMEQRLDARILSTRDDLELMLKAELMGSLAHLETLIEHRFGAAEDRLDALETTD